MFGVRCWRTLPYAASAGNGITCHGSYGALDACYYYAAEATGETTAVSGGGRYRLKALTCACYAIAQRGTVGVLVRRLASQHILVDFACAS